MKLRLAIVAWWLGALFAALMVLGMLATLITIPAEMGVALSAELSSMILITGPLWCISYVLGGGFWKPPR